MASVETRTYLYLGPDTNKAGSALGWYRKAGAKVTFEYFYQDDKMAQEAGLKKGDLAIAFMELKGGLYVLSSSPWAPSGAVALMFSGPDSAKELSELAEHLMDGATDIMHPLPEKLTNNTHVCFDDKFGISWVLSMPYDM